MFLSTCHNGYIGTITKIHGDDKVKRFLFSLAVPREMKSL